MRSKLFAAVLLLAPAAFAAAPFSFAAIGDAPYLPEAGGHQIYPATSYEALIASINADPAIEFTIHVGDIKAGDTLCEAAVYAQNLAYFDSYLNPVMYTPGDNEWTDCHRANNGGMDPLDRLSLIRSTFFPDNKSLGQNPIPLFKDEPPYLENSLWRERPAMFITLNQPGSNNNRNRTTSIYQDPADAEWTARNASNMAFLDHWLQVAAANPQVKLVVIASQANPFERFIEPNQGYTVSGYGDFIDRLRAFVSANPDKHVLYIGGDTHTPRMDHPLTDVYPSPTQLTPAGTPYPNFTRLEVYGAAGALNTWWKVTVDEDGNATAAAQAAQ